MSPHISYHPIGTDTIKRYVGYISVPDAVTQATAEYDAAGGHDRFRQPFVAMASAAATLTGSFDTTHGLNLAATQGFFGRFHYLHDAPLSAMYELLRPYTQPWHELIPSWPATETAANRLQDQPSSGVFIAAGQVGSFMNDAHSRPELQTALAQHFPGEKLQVLWVALTEAYESGLALLEASGVIEPDLHDITQSACRTNQTNCDPAGLRLYLATAPAAAPAEPSGPPVEPPGPPAASPQPTTSRTSTPPPIADPSTVSQADWEPAVVMLGNAHGARSDLVIGPGGFLESWDGSNALMSLVHPAVGLGMALWFDWAEDWVVEERCRAMADWRIGWPDEDFRRMEELQFSWDGSEGRGHVDQGLDAFDRWLADRGRGMRLIAVQTNGDFYVSFLYPEAGAYQFIAALGQAGVEAFMQDGSIPPAPAATAPRPPTSPRPTTPASQRKLPDAPSLAERMRERANNPDRT